LQSDSRYLKKQKKLPGDLCGLAVFAAVRLSKEDGMLPVSLLFKLYVKNYFPITNLIPRATGAAGFALAKILKTDVF
jgi:hypothetical protein